MKRHTPRCRQRAGERPTVGLIVEGETEFGALPLLHTERLVPRCPPLKPTNLWGVGARPGPVGIARMVAPKVIAHVVAGRRKVVVCLDREERSECAGEFAQEIARALAVELARTRLGRDADVHVVVADRAFEAWVLADARGLHARGHLKVAPKFHSFEGQLGKQGRKGELELRQLLGRDYDKRRDGRALFRELDFAAARQHAAGQRGSRSLDKLLRTLGA